MMEELVIPVNECQTPVTRALLNQYPEEVQEQFLDFCTTVPMIKNLISPERKHLKDLPRDEHGIAIVDITNPPIIHDTDFFRRAAITYRDNGWYTNLRPNSNPNSDYRKFWDREIDRIYNGVLREEDGMWVSGYMYWFLNYQPMMINIVQEGKKRALRQEGFPMFFDGIWWRFLYYAMARDNGHHSAELAKRGSGKSYSLSSIMSHNLIFGETKDNNKRNVTVLTAYQKEYLKDDKDGTFSKFVPTLSFLASATPFPRLMLRNSPIEMSWQMGYKDEYGKSKGSLNQVIGVSAKDDSDKLRGKRGWILFEEFGNFNGLLELYDSCRKGVEDGDYTFGEMVLVGTANNKESNFQSAKTLLYAPVSYNIQELRNVYDKVGQGKDFFAYFFPAYINRAGCYDKDGNSDVTKALLQILLGRYKAKYGADPTSVLRVIAEDPVTPSEAIIKVKEAYFNVQALTERADQLDKNPDIYNDIYVGELYINGKGSVDFRPTDEIPIRTFPVDNDTKGALEIYQMPKKQNDEVMSSRYIIGVDPVSQDQAESSSLYSCFVFDLFTDTIVAEYTGRKPFADENFELTRLLCLFYNAKCLYESNTPGVFAYFQSRKSTHLLAETPEYLKEKQLIKYTLYGSNAYGVKATAAVNNYANQLIKDWLNKPVPVSVRDEETKEKEEVFVPMIYTLKCRALIEELIQFSPEINVDRVRALGIAMLYRQEYIIKYGDNMNEESRKKIRKDDPSNDIFFLRNYDNKFFHKSL